MSRSNRGFVALETIAIALLVILVLVVISVLTFSSHKKTQVAQLPSSNTSEKINKKVTQLESQKKYNIVDTKDFFAKEYEGVPFNERLFYDTQVEYAPYVKISPTTSTQFEGKIVSVSQENGLRIKMLGLLPVALNKEIEFYYEPQVLSRIQIKYGTVDDLKTGDDITIDETNNVTKKYQESIVSVEINKTKH